MEAAIFHYLAPGEAHINQTRWEAEMPLKLNVGLTKKIGEANYGSRGASVNFDVELEANLTGEPEQLRERIRYLFALAKDAVEEELSGSSPTSTNGHHGNGYNNGQNGNGNSNGSRRSSKGRPATASQVRAIHAIASRNHVDLDSQLSEFGVTKPDGLSLSQASELIDALKSQPTGTGGRR
jgi:hypothetical protein